LATIQSYYIAQIQAGKRLDARNTGKWSDSHLSDTIGSSYLSLLGVDVDSWYQIQSAMGLGLSPKGEDEPVPVAQACINSLLNLGVRSRYFSH
jgi:hypothetical protein